MTAGSTPRWAQLPYERYFQVVVALLAAVTAVHLLAAPDSLLANTVYRRLYYVPIIVGAFGYGFYGGLATSLVAVWLYAPHAFLHLHAADSAPLGDRALELVMFLVVGSVTGLLVERERRAMSGLRAAEQRADELGALMTLTSGLAHEVRNPLSAIQGSLDILSDDLAVGSPPQAIADEALAEVSRLDHALGDFVRFVAPVSPSDADAAPKDDG